MESSTVIVLVNIYCTFKFTVTIILSSRSSIIFYYKSTSTSSRCYSLLLLLLLQFNLINGNSWKESVFYHSSLTFPFRSISRLLLYPWCIRTVSGSEVLFITRECLVFFSVIPCRFTLCLFSDLVCEVFPPMAYRLVV